MKIQPYLFFNGRCEEALDFYNSTLGAEVLMLMRFKDNPDKPGPECVAPALDDKVMHCSFRIGSDEIMASDGMGTGGPDFKGVSLSLSIDTPAEADRIFAALGEGGQVQMPIGQTFFSPRFGMVADRFGVSWMVIVQPQT